MDGIDEPPPLGYNVTIRRGYRMDIRKLREMYGLSRVQFSDRTQIPVKTICNWELGVRMPQAYLMSALILFLEYKLVSDRLEPVAASVRNMRKSLGMNQRQFSELTGVPLSTLRNWEQGIRKPSSYYINMLSSLLKDPEICEAMVQRSKQRLNNGKKIETKGE